MLTVEPTCDQVVPSVLRKMRYPRKFPSASLEAVQESTTVRFEPWHEAVRVTLPGVVGMPSSSWIVDGVSATEFPFPSRTLPYTVLFPLPAVSDQDTVGLEESYVTSAPHVIPSLEKFATIGAQRSVNDSCNDTFREAVYPASALPEDPIVNPPVGAVVSPAHAPLVVVVVEDVVVDDGAVVVVVVDEDGVVSVTVPGVKSVDARTIWLTPREEGALNRTTTVRRL